jgi:hypothetical protein
MGKNSTSFKPGESKGRPKGVPNKITQTVRATVLEVFNRLQDDPVNNLEAFAKRYPRDFYTISAKLIPQEVQATVDANVNWNETKTYEVEQKADISY